ncbi:MAG: CRISPR system precrRNA processing endoribonuclease RAMP protein Cas6, partial [Anaerolineae bacterium]
FSLRGDVRNMYVLPDPSFVFHTLAGYWDDLAGDTQQEDIKLFAAKSVVISHLNIKSIMLRFAKSPQIGFVGQVMFKILDETDQVMIRHLNRLADLAFYTGIGSKTPMGMGQLLRKKGKRMR